MSAFAAMALPVGVGLLIKVCVQGATPYWPTIDEKRASTG